MKLSKKAWCRIQEILLNLKCPDCFRANIKFSESEEENAECQDCGCKFEFNPDRVPRWD